MKPILQFLGVCVVAGLFCSFLVETGHAGYISVGTYDAAGDQNDFFFVGDDVRIKAVSSHEPMTINVTNPDGIVIHTETVPSFQYDETLGGLTDMVGLYMVTASSPMDGGVVNYAHTYYRVSELPPEPIPVGGIATAITLRASIAPDMCLNTPVLPR